MSADLFPTLGVEPMIGRTFTAEDDRQGATPTMILSYEFWQWIRWLSMHSVGLSVNFYNTPYTILVRHVPREFHFPRTDTRFWMTNRLGESAYQASERTNNWLNAIGRSAAPASDPRAGPGRDGRDCRSVEAAVSEGEQQNRRVPFALGSGRVGPLPAAAHGPDGRSRLRPADCACQSLQLCCWSARSHGVASLPSAQPWGWKASDLSGNC